MDIEMMHFLRVVNEPSVEEVVPLNESVVKQETVLVNKVLIESLQEIVEKLNNHMEPDSDSYSSGIEAGMNRAADMLQNFINRIE